MFSNSSPFSYLEKMHFASCIMYQYSPSSFNGGAAGPIHLRAEKRLKNPKRPLPANVHQQIIAAAAAAITATAADMSDTFFVSNKRILN